MTPQIPTEVVFVIIGFVYPSKDYPPFWRIFLPLIFKMCVEELTPQQKKKHYERIASLATGENAFRVFGKNTVSIGTQKNFSTGKYEPNWLELQEISLESEKRTTGLIVCQRIFSINITRQETFKKFVHERVDSDCESISSNSSTGHSRCYRRLPSYLRYSTNKRFIDVKKNTDRTHYYDSHRRSLSLTKETQFPETSYFPVKIGKKRTFRKHWKIFRKLRPSRRLVVFTGQKRIFTD